MHKKNGLFIKIRKTLLLSIIILTKNRTTTEFITILLLLIIIPTITADPLVENLAIEELGWCEISLFIYDDFGNLKMDIKLLRPLWWVEEIGAKIGGCVHLVLPEKGINDRFLVKDIVPCTDISLDDENLVTGLFKSYGPTVKMSFVGSDEVIECTYGHRFFSEDRHEWIPAQDLFIGERIKSKNGFIIIASLAFHDEFKEVFNLEILDSDHSFYIGENNVTVHNDCADIFNLNGPFLLDFSSFKSLHLSHLFQNMKQPIAFAQKHFGELQTTINVIRKANRYARGFDNWHDCAVERADTIRQFQIGIIKNPDSRKTEVVMAKVHMPEFRKLDAEILTAAIDNNMILITEDSNILRNALELGYLNTHFVVWRPLPKIGNVRGSLQNVYQRAEYIIHTYANGHHPDEFLGPWRPKDFISEYFPR